MGAWGFRCFENDDALDWVSNDLAGAEDFSPVIEALQTVAEMDEEEYLEMPQAGAALAAAEVVAAGLGRPAPDLPPEVMEWIEAHPAEDVCSPVALALTVVGRVARNSEMQGNWLQPHGEEKWQAVLADLKRRLQG